MNLKVRKKLYNPAAAASPLSSDSCPRLTITVCRMSFNLLEAAHVLSHRVDDGWMTFFCDSFNSFCTATSPADLTALLL